MAIKISYLNEREDVYDITVKDNHNFYANDILVHNCCEIDLPTKPLNSANDGLPERKLIRMTKLEYEKYKIWKNHNHNTPLKRQ